jgi:hypothetical protein
MIVNLFVLFSTTKISKFMTLRVDVNLNSLACQKKKEGLRISTATLPIEASTTKGSKYVGWFLLRYFRIWMSTRQVVFVSTKSKKKDCVMLAYGITVSGEDFWWYTGKKQKLFSSFKEISLG